jgi:hypothetical protein
MLRDISNILGDAFFGKQKLALAVGRRDGAEVAAQGIAALANLGAPGIKHLLLAMRSGDYRQRGTTDADFYPRVRAAACLAKVLPAVEAAGLVPAAIQAFALLAITDTYGDPRERGLQGLGALLPRLSDSIIYARLGMAAEAATHDEGDSSARLSGEAILKLLEAQNSSFCGNGRPHPDNPGPGVPLPRISVRNFRIQLVETSAMGERPDADLQKAIQLSNAGEYKYAEGYFERYAAGYGHPLLSGYAYAELGVLNVRAKKLKAACDYFYKVLESERALLESVHHAAGYLSVMYDAAGLANKGALLALLASQTEALLGYHLRPETEREVRELTQAYPAG